jgi:hypothetical protein
MVCALPKVTFWAEALEVVRINANPNAVANTVSHVILTGLNIFIFVF